ncbi:STAS domain-containing protein [Saccharothrix obliqua]|uniref:STAS domain-containing protein n=1 Tax=Saccharothrix obliqua TaxID=2861747 RepID=UPI001C5ECA7F|nr:STAS domain-containing protein [Saccharothrix obliqua]MBW4721246.1 STAS domain-containing protein [Saccharothrix obliqua]
MEQPLITVDSARWGDVLVVSVAGEVDQDTAPRVRAALRGRAAALVLDLSAVTFFGSAGIRVLLDAHREVAAFAVVAANRPVLRPLEATGLDCHLPLCPSPAAALDRVRRTGTRA